MIRYRLGRALARLGESAWEGLYWAGLAFSGLLGPPPTGRRASSGTPPWHDRRDPWTDQ